MEKIRLQTAEQNKEKSDPKASLLGSLFSWGGSSPEKASPGKSKKLTVKEELKKILNVIDESGEGAESNDSIVQMTCSLEISQGKIKLYQSLAGGKETVEFRYLGLGLNYVNTMGQHKLRLKVRSIQLLSSGQHEVTVCMKISDPANEYLNVGLSYTRRGSDNYLSANLDVVCPSLLNR